MKKKVIIGIIIGIIVLLIGLVAVKLYDKEDLVRPSVNVEDSLKITGGSKILRFMKAISGIKANSIEIIDNPVGISGEFFAPDETLIRGLNYFLKETNNDKMENLNIVSEKGAINIKIDYRVTNKIKTPIEVKIKPTINETKDLVINIEEVRFLDLKISKWIVNLALDNFIEDWFPKDGNLKIDFNKSNVIVYKENFNGLEINNISLENGLEINVVVDLEKLIK